MTARVVPVKFNRTDALALWHDVTLERVRSTHQELSPRQIVILTTVYLEEGPHTVRSLARKLGLTKSPVTRALDRLETARLVRRCDDPMDKRSVVIERTASGTHFLSDFADQIRDIIKTRVA